MTAAKKRVSIITKSPEETIRLGKKIGTRLKNNDIVALYGSLGAGKTHLIKGVGLGLKVKSKITSPTFTLINEYQGRIPLYHFDLYRINSIQKICQLGIDEYFEVKGVVVIEWAEKAKAVLPEKIIKINLDFVSFKERKIEIRGLKI